MERRKVQQVGNSTYTVSLPKEWAQAVDIEAGNEVSLQTHIDDVLVVEPDDPDGAVAIDANAGGAASGQLEALVRAAYASGAKRARLTADASFSDEQAAAIRRTARTLSGVTIEHESRAEIVLETLLDPAEVSIRQSTRQLLYVALDAHRNAVAATVAPASPAGPVVRDDHADRLFALVDRHLQRALETLGEVDALGLSRSALFACWRAARALERVADHAERIAVIGSSLEPPEDAAAERIETIGVRTRGLVETGVDLVLADREATAARAALRERDAVRSDLRATRRPLVDDGHLQLVRVLDSLERTAALGGNLAEVGLRTGLDSDDSDG